MKDPSRVVRLEWRKARRQQHKGLTSHSWLEAYLQDGRRLRLEFFGDTGLSESVFASGKGERESVIYENRIAGPHDFARPVTAKRLHEIAEAAAARPYSLTDWNCHHFVLEVWNKVVITLLQRTHYPDRMKTNVLWGASESFGKLFSEGANWAAQLGIGQPPPSGAPEKRREPAAAVPGPLGKILLGSYSTAPVAFESYSTSPVAGQDLPLERGSSTASSSSSSRLSQPSTPLTCPSGDEPLGDPAGGASRVRVEAREEEGGRVSGEVVSVPRPGSEGDRLVQLSRALDEGAICVLALGKGLVTADLPSSRPKTPAAWAETWLPGAVEDGLRMTDHLGSMDPIDLVMRVLVPGSDGMAGRRRPTSTRFASLSSESLESESLASGAGDRGNVASVCFVVLSGSEVRLAIYAVLGPHNQGPRKRLRLLSGNLHEGKEGTFAFALSDVKERDVPATARSCVEEELSSLQIALSTGDWGFVTLL